MHPDFSRDLNNPANLLKVTNRWAEAEPLMRWTLAIAEQSHGVDSPEVVVRLNNLARLLHATNRPAEAELLMRRSVEILQQFSRETGYEHQNMHVVLDNYRELLQKLDLPSDEIEPRVQKATTNVEILKPITPEVDRMLGPAKLVDEVLADLDRNYIKDGKSAIYFLPLDQPIAPQLDHLFGHSEIDTSRNKRVRSGQCAQLST